MRILLLGANGFIGRHLAVHLRLHGHQVVACARRPDALGRMGFETVRADLAQNSGWEPALKGIDVLVNAAGLLHGSTAQMRAVHRDGPAHVYRLARAAGVKKLILISAVGLKADTPFARHRIDGETVAAQSGLACVILRPSMVVGETSYGGSSMLRGLAAMPLVTPVIGDGAQPFDPIHVDDLGAVVRQAAESDRLNGQTLCPCGPERLTQAQMLDGLRAWLGRPPARHLHLPVGVAKALGWLGERLNLGPISLAAVAQLQHGVGADYPAYHKATGQTPRGFSQILAARPAGSQDLWHARLYLLRPLLRFGLMFMWLVSGLVGLFLPAGRFVDGLSGLGLPDAVWVAMARAAGGVDLLFALALLIGWRLPRVALWQLAMVGLYTLFFGLAFPALWLEPYGGLLKNIPVLLLIMVHKLLEEER